MRIRRTVPSDVTVFLPVFCVHFVHPDISSTYALLPDLPFSSGIKPLRALYLPPTACVGLRLPHTILFPYAVLPPDFIRYLYPVAVAPIPALLPITADTHYLGLRSICFVPLLRALTDYTAAAACALRSLTGLGFFYLPPIAVRLITRMGFCFWFAAFPLVVADSPQSYHAGRVTAYMPKVLLLPRSDLNLGIYTGLTLYLLFVPTVDVYLPVPGNTRTPPPATRSAIYVYTITTTHADRTSLSQFQVSRSSS